MLYVTASCETNFRYFVFVLSTKNDGSIWDEMNALCVRVCVCVLVYVHETHVLFVDVCIPMRLVIR